MSFYVEKGRAHLPWRVKNMTPYKVWVSEIMLQQTQVDRVIVFYKNFLKRFPSVKALSEASWEEFLPYYQGLGYYNRGRNMLKAAKLVQEEYGGRFPKERSELMKLPGVGEYTASAILSFSHNDNHLSWDTNFFRVFGRFFYGSKESEIERDVFENKIKADKKDFNGAIMDFGSLVCVKKPKCEECSLSGKCAYYESGGTREKIVEKEKVSFPTKEAQVYVILHKDHKEYYSQDKKKYLPFIVGSKHNTRSGIKDHFQEKYGLSISVRPPHKKTYVDGMPTLMVYAQVLLGEHNFSSFTKKELSDTIKT